jgi:hypothetical protein
MSGIQVEVTAHGLPAHVAIPRAELRYGAARIAEQVLAQCQAARLAAGMEARQQLEALGIDGATLTGLGVPTRDDVAAHELAERRRL